MTTLTTLTLPVLPLTTGVVVPTMVVTVVLETVEAQAAADAAMEAGGELLLVPKLNGTFASVGAVAKIETAGELPNGQRALVLRASHRAVIGVGVPGHGAGGETEVLWVQATPMEEDEFTPELQQLANEYRITAELLLERRGMERFAEALSGIELPGALADTVNGWPELSHERRIELLEAVEAGPRLQLALTWVREALAEAELKDKIRKDVSEGMEKQQREFLLRQQLAAIRKELGENENTEDALAEYRAKIESLPTHVAVAASREVDRLERMGDQNAESGWIRSWLDTVLDIPWLDRTTDRLNIGEARAVLDADTTGLDEAKERIVEWLAVRKLRSERAAAAAAAEAGLVDAAPSLVSGAEPTVSTQTDGTTLIVPRGDVLNTADPIESPAEGDDSVIEPDATNSLIIDTVVEAVRQPRRGDGAIIALVGPPGVGKTSLGESVARAMGRSFVRVALGGVRDEAEIRGHRRTYVGAQAGRIVRALAEAKTMNPVILLDEIDKLTSGGYSGDPAAALLEVLDPAQNHTFRDHYLEVDLDLSDVVFLATANSLDTIPGPLLDRMEVIAVDGYTDEEKVAIVRNHLLVRQLELTGLQENEVEISDEAVLAVIEGHTREPGVRSLERAMAKMLRKMALRVAADPTVVPVRVLTPEDVKGLLGRPKLTREEMNPRTDVAGVVTGLAVTGAGGDVLFVEASAMPSSSGEVSLTVTGQLGDVMKESASIALSYVRAHAELLGVDRARLEGQRIHIHFPAGAVPKDGPSAGIAITTALVSLLTDVPVRNTVAMTGEVTLQGRVLPIGGVKQKLLAAHRAGIKTVILPERNGVDLDDLPENVRSTLEIHLASDVADVVRWALVS